MKTITRLFVSSLIFAGFVSSGSIPNQTAKAVSQTGRIKALVGGTLIDGHGGKPLRNSVIIIEGERIKAVGQIGSLPIPEDAEVISTEGMTVLPGLWDMHVHLQINGHSDYAHWDKTYPSQIRIGDYAGLGQTTAAGRRDQRARSGRAAEGEHRSP